MSFSQLATDPEKFITTVFLYSLIAVIAFIGFLVLYFLYCVGLYNMSKRFKIDNRCFAFIPLFQYLNLAKIAHINRKNNNSFAKTLIFFRILNFLTFVGGAVCALADSYQTVFGNLLNITSEKTFLTDISSILLFVSLISAVIFAVLYFVVLNRIYNIFLPNHSVVLLISSIFIPFLIPIFVFKIRYNRINIVSNRNISYEDSDGTAYII